MYSLILHKLIIIYSPYHARGHVHLFLAREHYHLFPYAVIFLQLSKLEINRPPDKSAYQKIIFLISQPKHMLWVFKRTVSMRRFF